jgi:putative ABC transport system permease protein
VLRATIKSLLARKLRLVMTALAVVLGVGFMAGTLVLTDTATRSFDGLFGDVFGGTDIVVQGSSAFTGGPAGPGGGGAEEREPISQAVFDDVAAVQGVAAIDGDVSGFAQVINPKTGDVVSTGGAPTIGNSWNDVANPFELRSGSAPVGPGEIAVDASTASLAGLTVGETVDVVTPVGSRSFQISGIVGIAGQDSLLGATLVLFDLPTAQEIFDREGQYDHLYVVAAEGITPQALRASIAAVLPKGYDAITGTDAADQQAEAIGEALGFVRTFLLVFAFIAVFVGAFIIFNTFNIIVTQRTREIGLLRALGASRRQVLTSIVIEAVLVGLVASIVGLGLGVLLAIFLRWLFGAVGLDLPATGQVVAVRTIVASLMVGTVVTVVASLAPARRASRVTPVQALRESAAPTASLRRRTIVGGILTVAGAGLLLAGLFADVPNELAFVGFGAQLVFIGVAILSPLVARPLAAAIGMLFRNAAGRLGTENAKRNPRRTASTSSALMVGLGLVVMVTVLAASLKASAAIALDENLRSDFILTTTNFSPMSPKLTEALTAEPAMGAVSGFRQGQIRVDGATDFLAGVDPATISEVAKIPLRAGTLTSLNDDHTVLIFSGTAELKGLTVGDQVELTFARTGRQTFTVGGIYTDNSLLGNYTISLDAYEQNFVEQLDAIVFADRAPGVDVKEARAAIDVVLEEFPNVEVRNQAEFKEEQNRAIDQVLGFVLVLLLLSGLIAVIGIINTLGLSIYERVRELGLLRAVGMSRRQVKRMVRVEAVIIAVIGALLGLVVGLLLAWALQQAMESLGVKAFSIPVGRLVVYVGIAALLGVLASLWPAHRAAKLDVLEAISYE